MVNFYSQSSAPFFHSYIKPIVNMNKKIIIEAKPKIPILPNETAQGNKNAISRSKIIKKYFR